MNQLTPSMQRCLHRPSSKVCQHHIPLSHLCPDCRRNGPIWEPAAIPEAPKVVAAPVLSKPAKVGKRRKVMNKTETAFSLRLEADIAAGLIESWHYEALTLRWGTLDNIQYTADFTVFRPDGSILLVETKGAHLFKDTTQKFKAARNHWPQFTFSMWQRKKGEWSQLL